MTNPNSPLSLSKLLPILCSIPTPTLATTKASLESASSSAHQPESIHSSPLKASHQWHTMQVCDLTRAKSIPSHQITFLAQREKVHSQSSFVRSNPLMRTIPGSDEKRLRPLKQFCDQLLSHPYQKCKKAETATVLNWIFSGAMLRVHISWCNFSELSTWCFWCFCQKGPEMRII